MLICAWSAWSSALFRCNRRDLYKHLVRSFACLLSSWRSCCCWKIASSLSSLSYERLLLAPINVHMKIVLITNFMCIAIHKFCFIACHCGDLKSKCDWRSEWMLSNCSKNVVAAFACNSHIWIDKFLCDIAENLNSNWLKYEVKKRSQTWTLVWESLGTSYNLAAVIVVLITQKCE